MKIDSIFDMGQIFPLEADTFRFALREESWQINVCVYHHVLKRAATLVSWWELGLWNT